ncbi:hypothetical protein A6M14_10070 [Acinetobacter sp. Ac_877]|uniref:hypothetical protein n=1 Tax=Acinetobacter portensis TaxID=1839785 RepID=UPI00128DE529|nr:hypothetical protein [Acinetobacter portensis]MPW41815.1 hypothetical protein [Acinetobacter portensis]
MKKLLALSILVALTGCAEKKPLTPQEQWHGYCTSVGNAARSIVLDRQNGIEKDKAIEHADKIDDETTKGFILKIIDEAYAIPVAEMKNDVEGSRDKLKAKVTERCIATPHDQMPDYKPF